MQTVRFAGWTLLALILTSAVDLKAAHACKCIPTLASSLDGAVDVPLDIVPILRGFKSGPATWTAQDGSNVEFDERSGRPPMSCPGPYHELRPKSVLRPNTVYTIRASVSGDDDAEIRFTTGTHFTPELILPKPTLIATLVRRRLYDSCNTPINGCLALGDAETEVTVLDAQGAELNWFVARGELHLETTGDDVACIEARTRNAAGQRSEPVRLCGAELEVHDAFFSDYRDSFLRCVGGRIPSLLEPDAAVPWPSDAGAADAAPTATTEAGAAAANDTEASTTTGVEAAAATSSDDGCSLASDGQSNLLAGFLTVLAGVRRRRSRA